jgi:hypothetical protein
MDGMRRLPFPMRRSTRIDTFESRRGRRTVSALSNLAVGICWPILPVDLPMTRFTFRRRVRVWVLVFAAWASVGGAGSGCMDKMLTVRSDPPGALVFLNGVEAGRTPVTRDFVWYGTYDVAMRKPGYQTLRAHSKVIAPWWGWVPFDLLAELAPLRFRDEQTLRYTLKPETAAASDPQQMLNRAEALSERLESSGRTRQPHAATQPATAQPAATQPATTREAQPATRAIPSTRWTAP